MRGRPKKQQGTTSSAAAPVKEKEREIGKEKEARARGRPRRKGMETEMGGDGKEPATEKQKKTQAKEKEVREDGEQNDGEREKKVCPQFFKFFFPEQSGERLKIPPMFGQHLKEQPTGPVSLKGPSGKKWQATLASESEVWSFEQGWKEFVTDHSLKLGYFLVFTYDGPSQFSVTVFSPSGIIDPAALDAKPMKEVVDKIEEDEEGVQGDMDAGGASEVPILPTEEGNAVTRRITRAMTGGANELPPLPREEGHGVTGKRTRAMSDLPADANASKMHSTVTKKADKRRHQAGTSKDVPPIGHNATFSLLDESKCFNKTQIRDKNVPRIGKFLLKTSRAPAVISQRRPVTEEDRDLALRKAKEFKSKYPFTVQIMMESYVYVGFFMNITCEFDRESLPQTNKKMTLWDPLGKAWKVNYVYYSDRSVGAFIGGWGKLAIGNNLEKFDVCIFELFKEDNIKVHIYRVVPELTLLLRASNRD